MLLARFGSSLALALGHVGALACYACLLLLVLSYPEDALPILEGPGMASAFGDFLFSSFFFFFLNFMLLRVAQSSYSARC